LNPQKLAGQCGKLKCCLNYELDTYLDALKDFPSADSKLHTEKGTAFCQKTDIFKGILWFSYKDDPSNWYSLTKDQVHRIQELNREKKKVQSLEEYASENYADAEIAFENAVGQDSLTRFDRPKSKRRKNKRRKKGNNRKRTSRNA
jgi:hypothetical protein